MASGENEQVRPFVPDIGKRGDRLMTALPHGRRFGRLTGPLHPKNLLAEILDCLLGHGRRDERRPDWTRRDCIRANVFLREQLR
jgi:hypothetical protein